MWFSYPIPLPLLLSFAPENLYATEVTGVIGPLVVGKRGQLVTRPDQIQKALHPLCYCCEGWCLGKWKEELGPSLSRAIITTERTAYASMCETSRQHHYQVLLRGLLRYKTGVATTGEGVVRTGKPI